MPGSGGSESGQFGFKGLYEWEGDFRIWGKRAPKRTEEDRIEQGRRVGSGLGSARFRGNGQKVSTSGGLGLNEGSGA